MRLIAPSLPLPHELTAAATDQGLRTEADLDAFLNAHHVRDHEARISFKINKMSQGELATDRDVRPGELATWLRRANLTLDRTYTEQQVTEALAAARQELAEAAEKAKERLAAQLAAEQLKLDRQLEDREAELTEHVTRRVRRWNIREPSIRI